MRQYIYDFLFIYHCDYITILYHLRDISTCLSIRSWWHWQEYWLFKYILYFWCTGYEI